LQSILYKYSGYLAAANSTDQPITSLYAFKMPISSRFTIPIEICSLQAYLFDTPTAPLPDKVAFYDAERPETHFLTLEDFRLWSLRLAAGLKKAGLQPGDRVLIFSGNSLFFPVAFMGILMAGGIFTGANPGYVARELAYQLKNADAKFLFCADGSLELGLEAAQSIGMGKERIFLFDDLVFEGINTSRLGVRNWKTLIEPEAVGKSFKWYEPEDPKDTICCLNYSSGTTGVPKGVMITHYNYVSNAKQFAHLQQLHPDEPEKTKKAYVLQPTPFLATQD
jgi:4-coumarate--CoA ligase